MHGHPARIMPRTDNSKMPIIALNMIPRAIQQVMNPALVKKDEGVEDIMMGRYISLFFSLFTILILFRWASELYGTTSGIIAALLYSFCPNSLANASFVSTDVFSVLMLLISFYLMWKWLHSGTLKHFIFFSIAIAFSQLVKQSLFHLYVLVPLFLICCRIFDKKVLENIRKPYLLIIVFVLINFLVINFGYYFYHSFQPLGNYHFMSHLFIELQNSLPSGIPVPLPTPFVEGLDMAKYYDQIGGGMNAVSSFGKVTILGHEATGGSFWYYYFVTILFKTPVGILVLFFIGLFVKPVGWEKLLLLFPVIYFLVVFSFFYKTQAGVRHIIFLYPFIFLIAVSVWNHAISTRQKKLFFVLCIYILVSVSFYWANYYPYTNELIMDKKNAWQIVGDANLEILQGRKIAEAYLKKHPDVQFVPKQAIPGIYLLNTEQYLDTWNTGEYQWIRKYPIVGHVGYSWLLIKVPGSRL